jgi:hypothetical protein
VFQGPDEHRAAVAEDILGAAVVDPHAAHQRGDDEEVEGACEGVGVAGDVVDVGGAVERQLLRLEPLDGVGVVPFNASQVDESRPT